MTIIFRPPVRFHRPGVRVDTPLEDQVPAKYFRLADLPAVSANVYVTTGGAVTEVQPLSWDLVSKMYQGGAENPVTTAEKAMLIAANPEYAACMFDDSVVIVIPPVGGSGYGVTGYGSDGFGA